MKGLSFRTSESHPLLIAEVAVSACGGIISITFCLGKSGPSLWGPHWRSKPVGVDKVRVLRGVMAAQNVGRGQFATTSSFTSDAAVFARDNGINLLDIEGLSRLIAQRTPEQRQTLLDVALAADLRELRDQDGRAHAEAGRQGIMGLPELCALQNDPADAVCLNSEHWRSTEIQQYHGGLS